MVGVTAVYRLADLAEMESGNVAMVPEREKIEDENVRIIQNAKRL